MQEIAKHWSHPSRRFCVGKARNHADEELRVERITKAKTLCAICGNILIDVSKST